MGNVQKLAAVLAARPPKKKVLAPQSPDPKQQLLQAMMNQKAGQGYGGQQ